MLPTSFLDNFHPLSMRCSLNLQLRSAHEKPQQPNRFDSPTDTELPLYSTVYAINLPPISTHDKLLCTCTFFV